MEEEKSQGENLLFPNLFMILLFTIKLYKLTAKEDIDMERIKIIIRLFSISLTAP